MRIYLIFLGCNGRWYESNDSEGRTLGTVRREPSFFDPRKIAFKLTREPANSRVTEVLIKRTDSRARDFIGHFSTVEYSRVCLKLSNPDKHLFRQKILMTRRRSSIFFVLIY